MGDVEITVWLACGYAIFLLLVAFVLDLSARHAATRTQAWRSGTFTYQEDHDAWVCEEDQWLWPMSFDPDSRVMRYRANPKACNACPNSCTTSELGREVTRNVDPWPSSEVERFHRGIACAVVVLAVIWPLATMIGSRTPAELAVLAGAALGVSAASWPLWSHLHRTPARFPGHIKSETVDQAMDARSAAVAAAALRPIVYRSDRRAAGSGPVPVTIAARSAFATRWGAFENPAAGDPPLPSRSSRTDNP
ncbi:hypothetical protein [Pengzhenrongella frigida]|uniref:Uncharacterized protein n=1 Tax=Pengzhenrongella frigida TaxID=1259133 RepID=A0A4Q5N419_9MICO|nr:hypothetical protein [Cellulomonas sp. HLT2-17]RYV53009.1 hypothetical protein EUA98_00530 [Cellulomonas sp. HLT2-17]